MRIADRLREERARLGMSQDEMARAGEVHRKSQGNYEAGERAPDADYLAAIAAMGADVLYIVTGVRGGQVAPVALSQDEQELIDLFRAAPLAVKAAAIGALQGAAHAAPARHKQIISAPGGQVAGRDVVNQGGKKK